jgi:HrpA-like RNA helicase
MPSLMNAAPRAPLLCITLKTDIRFETFLPNMDLPIFQYKQELIDAVENYQCLIVVGDTGSGKTTQLPQYLNYKMVVSQPRRIAAISAAERVCDEMGCSIGSVVGYSVGFDNQTSSNTRITFMTDGILLKYSQENPLFTDYELVILDEAHERSLDTDILLALLRNALNQRPELKLIVMSATINLEKFSDYFNCLCIFF